MSCQAKSKPRAVETHVTVPFVGWPASSGTIVANLIRRRGAAVVSFRCVGSSSSNPSLCWLPLDIVEPRPHIRSCPRRSRTLHRGSVEAQGRSGNCECLGLRDARPLALECSCGSSPNRCLPSAATAFRRAFEALLRDSQPPVSIPRLWPACDPCRCVCCRQGSAPVL